MIYLILLGQFFLIGLFAIGGGAATIPFLFDLTKKYNWFSLADLTNMVAVSEATPGPIGVNMATFAGIQAAGFSGGLCAVCGIVLPSLLIMILICRFVEKLACHQAVHSLLKLAQPAVMALILNAAFEVGLISLKNLLAIGVLCFILLFMRLYKASPIFYIFLSGLLGFTLKL